MSFLHLIIVALVQGITEFLPVSSSGHLVVVHRIAGTEGNEQVIDVAAHVGTLGAVVYYFWPDVREAIGGVPRLIRRDFETRGAKLALCLAIGTIPMVAVGIGLEVYGLYDNIREETAIVGWTTLGFGLVLYGADRWGGTTKSDEDWTVWHALVFGVFQAIALIPGTSRSGITITAGRMLGYDREGAARIAMLMSIPAILASGTYASFEVIATADTTAALDGVIVAILAAISAYFALKLMMRFLKSVSFTPYVVYRIILGLVILAFAYEIMPAWLYQG